MLESADDAVSLELAVDIKLLLLCVGGFVDVGSHDVGYLELMSNRSV